MSDESNLTPLLVCPFCGSEAARYSYHSLAVATKEEENNGGIIRYMSHCSSKREIGCPATSVRSFDSQQGADAAWNMGRGKAH